MPKYRLVGYTRTRQLGRVRVYVAADVPPSPQLPVYLARGSAFDLQGEPLALQPAPSGVAARARAHLLGQSAPAHLAAIPFEPLPGD